MFFIFFLIAGIEALHLIDAFSYNSVKPLKHRH